MFWVVSVYFNIRNTLPKSGTFLLGHPVYILYIYIYIYIYKTYTKPLSVRKAHYAEFLFSLSTLTFQSLLVTPSTTRNIKTNCCVCVCVYTYTHTHTYKLCIFVVIRVDTNYFRKQHSLTDLCKRHELCSSTCMN